MSPQSETLFQAAPALPEEERLQLAERLLQTLPDGGADADDPQFLAELERRRMEIEQGIVKPVPWSEVRLHE